MAVLQRGDVVGHRLAAMVGTSEYDEEYELDFSDILFVLDSGAAFRLPFFPDENVLESTEIPPAAAPLKADVLKNVIGRRIVALVRVKDDDDMLWPDSVQLLLETGYVVMVASSAPHGTGGSGAFIEPANREILVEMVDFWTRESIVR